MSENEFEVVEVVTEASDDEGNIVVDDLVALVDSDGTVVATDETLIIEDADGDVLIDEVVSVIDEDGELQAVAEEVTVIVNED
ncbi:MAG: hypothetical protein NTZ03_12780 [Actinobacteria bacterium]|nr:hypothetical protein [Actinomycetota bacterium]